jgi:hypothetical protein
VGPAEFTVVALTSVPVIILDADGHWGRARPAWVPTDGDGDRSVNGGEFSIGAEQCIGTGPAVEDANDLTSS